MTMTKDEIKQWHTPNPFRKRDEAYMDAVLAQVKKRWLACADMRLGQLIVNTCCEAAPYLFIVPDEDWFVPDSRLQQTGSNV